MELIIIVILFIGNLAFLYFWQDKRDKVEENRFREFVIANKSKDLWEYTTALPTLNEEKLPEQDELVDVDNVDANELLRAIQNENK